MDSLRLILGNKNYSSWSLRPWLVLREAGIPFEETVMLFETPGWHDSLRALSPTGKVPALRHGDLVLAESLAICEYIAELYPEAKLWPGDPAARAVARSVSCEMHAGFAHLRKALWMDVTARTPKDVLSTETQADVARAQAIWEDCRSRFGAGGAFLFGRFSIADAMFAPLVWRFRTWEVPVRSPLAHGWYEAMLALPSMKEWEEAAIAEVAAQPTPLATPDPKSARQTFAVIFSSQHMSDREALRGYSDMAKAMEELAKKESGFLGIESARGVDGFGITVSYWESLEAIARWKANAQHRIAQERGKSHFYARYSLRVCSVERSYGKP